MSARKRTRVSLRERAYQSEHEYAMKLLFSPQQQAEVESQTRGAAHSALEATQDRSDAFADMLEGFRGHIRQVEVATGQALVSQQASFCDMLAANQESALRVEERMAQSGAETRQLMGESQRKNWEATRELLETHALEVRTRVLEEQRIMQADADKRLLLLEAEVESLWEADAHKAALAEETLCEADALLGFIDRAYEHERFFPGEIQDLGEILEDASNHLAQGAPEAALANAARVFRLGAGLRVRLEAECMAWETLHARAITRARQLFELARKHRRVKPVDLEGHEIEDAPEMHVNFWVEGKLEGFLQELREIIGELSAAQLGVDVPLLVRVNEELLPEKEAELASIVMEAREGVLNAQLRVNIADIVIQALGGQGYFLDEEAFEADDLRRQFYAKLRNYSGDEVLVAVRPEAEGGANELELHALTNPWRTAYQLKRGVKAVMGALERHGLVTGPLETLEDVGDGARERGGSTLNSEKKSLSELGR